MRTFLILAGIAAIGLLLVIRLFFSEMNSQEKEREWFVKNIRYEFSVAVDSVQRYHRTFVDGRVTAGDPHVYREDSLENSFKKHGHLQLITRYRNDSISFALSEFKAEVKKGDSIRFSSKDNVVLIFRSGNPVHTVKMSEVVFGWGNPPFRTK